MPSRETHVTIGVIACIGAGVLIAQERGGHGYTVESKDMLWTMLLLGLGGYFGSLAPDILEPSKPYGPHHRRSFHSLAAGGTTGYWIRRMWDVVVTASPRTLEGAVLLFAFGFCLGYLFHLLADGTTPFGLPII